MKKAMIEKITKVPGRIVYVGVILDTTTGTWVVIGEERQSRADAIRDADLALNTTIDYR